MGGIVFEDPVTAGVVLIRESIQSDNYVAGTSGWIINQDGTAEFSDGTFRGTIKAAQIVGSVFTSNDTSDPSIWVNEDLANTVRAYDANSNLVAEFGVQSGTDAALTLSDPADGLSLLVSGRQIQWFSGTSIATQKAALYQTANGILLNTQLAGGVAFDVAASAWKWVVPGSDTLETWHVVGSAGNPAFNTNWLTNNQFNGSTNWPGLQFQRTAHGRLAITGTFKANTTAPGLTVCQFPAGYRPALQQPVYIQRKSTTTTPNVSGFYGQVTGSGNLNIPTATGGGVAANDEFMISAEIPLF